MKRNETEDRNETTRETGGTCCPGSLPGSGAQMESPMAICSQMAGRVGRRMLGAAFVVLLMAVGLWVGFSHLEARSYERVTGDQVSTWDAMFLDLGAPAANE